MESVSLHTNVDSLIISKNGEEITIPIDDIIQVIKKTKATIKYSGPVTIRTNEYRSRIMFVFSTIPYYDFATQQLYHENGTVFSTGDYKSFPITIDQIIPEHDNWIKIFFRNIKYLAEYNNKKNIRLVTVLKKLNKKQLYAAEICSKHNITMNYLSCNTAGRTIPEILGVPKSLIDILTAGTEISYRTIEHIQRAYISDPEIITQLCTFLQTQNITDLADIKYISDIVYIIKLGLPLEKVWHFTHFSIPAQGLSLDKGTRLYRDYIKMSEDIGITYNRYPRNLRTVHDIVTMNHRVYLDQQKENSYCNIRNQLKVYEYQHKSYCMILPSNLGEIIREGNTLCHCVSSYIDDILNQKTCIMFMRYTDDLDEPLVTVEIQQGKMRQAHGKGNRGLTPEEHIFMDIYINYLKTITTSKAA